MSAKCFQNCAGGWSRGIKVDQHKSEYKENYWKTKKWDRQTDRQTGGGSGFPGEKMLVKNLFVLKCGLSCGGDGD